MSRHAARPGATANLFDGPFNAGAERGDGHAAKVVESAKDKDAGTAARARSKRGGATGSGNQETYNFKMGPADDSSPRREYQFKPPGRDVLQCGNFDAERARAGKRVPAAREPAAAKAFHKRIVAGGNASDGMKVSVSHAPGQDGHIKPPASGKKKHENKSQVSHLSNVGAPVRVTDDPVPKPTKRVCGGAGGDAKTDPWAGGKVQQPKQPDVEQRHKCAPAHTRQLHSFELEQKAPRHPGYVVAPPYGVD